MADSGHPPAELHERLLICRTIKLNAGAHGGHRRCCHAQMQKNAQNKPQIARLILCVYTTLQVYCNLFLTFCEAFELAPVYSVIALSRQAFCSYTFFIFSQRKDGENVAECYKTIEYPDRKAIAALYAAGAKAGQIAKEIGVSPRSIYAELKRGHEGDKLDKNFRLAYDADLAQKRAQESLRRRGRKKGGPAE